MKSRPVTRLVSGLLFVIEDKEKALNPLRFKAFLWQRVKDSNPHIQSQSLLCYLYTNPLYLSAAANRYYYTEISDIVNRVFKFFSFFTILP